MFSAPIINPLEPLQKLITAANVKAIQRFLRDLPATEVARATSRLIADDQAKLLTLLSPQNGAEIIEEVPEAQAIDLIEELDPEQAAAIVDEMPSDQQADLLGELDQADAEAILEDMEPGEAELARQLLTYLLDTAGGLMITEYLSYGINLQVQDILDVLRQNGEQYTDYDVQYTYITEIGLINGVVLGSLIGGVA